MIITPFGVAIVETDTHLSKWVVEHGRLDVQADYCRLFAQYIPTDGVVVDVGACIGDHTLSYSEMVGPKGRIHAFEPNPVAFECLAHNMVKRHNIICYRLALGRKDQRGFITNPNELNLGATIIGTTDDKDAPILVRALDSLAHDWPRIDFIKIDAEGCEPDIIAGAAATLLRLKPVLLIEMNRNVLKARAKTTRDIAEPVAKLGYSIQPSEPHLSLDLDNVDILCLPIP